MKCLQCGVEYEGRRSTSKYCGANCKQDFYRNRMSPVVTLTPESVTVKNAKSVTVKNGKCWCCGKSINSLLVCCGECSWTGRARATRRGEPESSGGSHRLTVMERLFYRPGETNFVSLPGRACYGVFE